MVDNDETAVEVAKYNARLNGVQNIEIIQSDGFSNVKQNNFTKIISHPPYHVITLIFQFLNILLKKDSIDCYLTAVCIWSQSEKIGTRIS